MDDLTSHIEDTIKDIDSIKRQLQQNSSEVKSQIQTNISRHMEALRNREVWLLNQVEVLQNAKEEVLHQQQTRLNKQLGLLQSKLAGSMQASQLDTSDLKPEESPYMTFRSDSAKLREVINNYGKVDVNGLPHAVFVQPGDPAASLPRHFEEYEDADHHVLYKTVEEVKRSQSSNNCVEISMPKLSPRKEDWLARPSTTTASYESSPKFSIPAFNEPSLWLKPTTAVTSSLGAATMVSTGSVCSTTSSSVSTIMSEGLGSLSLSSSHSVPSFKPYSTSASTQSWLKQIKHDLEDEDDFEIVDKVGSLEDDTYNLEGYLLTSKSAPDLTHMTERVVTDHPENVWLKPKNSDNTSASEKKSHDVFQRYFMNLAKDKVSWLSQKSSQPSCSETCQKKVSMDIENLGSCLSENKVWLRAEDVGEKELTWLCKANETCTGVTDCVSQPNCLDIYLQKAHENSFCCQGNNQYAGFKHYQGKADKKTWLKNSGKNVESTTPINTAACSLFHSSCRDTSEWLKKESTIRNPTPGKVAMVSFEHLTHSNGAWLKEDPAGKSTVSSTQLSEMPGWSYKGATSLESWVKSSGGRNNTSSWKHLDWQYKGPSDQSAWLHESRKMEVCNPEKEVEMVRKKNQEDNSVEEDDDRAPERPEYLDQWLRSSNNVVEKRENPGMTAEIVRDNSLWLVQ